MKRENAINEMDKIKPWIFLPYQEFDVVSYREKRNSIEVFDDKMFWLGSGVDSYRKMIRIIEQKGFLQPINTTSINICHVSGGVSLAINASPTPLECLIGLL